MKTYYNKKHREASYNPGDLVSVWTPIRKPGKCEKLLKLIRCTKGQPWELDKDTLGAELGLPTSTVIDALTDGLSRQKRNLMKVFGPVNAPEWLEMARQIRRPENHSASTQHYPSLHSAASLRPQRPAFSQSASQQTSRQAVVPSPSLCRFYCGRNWNCQCQRRPTVQRAERDTRHRQSACPPRTSQPFHSPAHLPNRTLQVHSICNANSPPPPSFKNQDLTPTDLTDDSLTDNSMSTHFTA
ncbi:hypothetical protein LAZ67_8001114 [Cordylochernes scorpioides]|uniref:Uncharacterized protein n=1 Tax=Cordylochernes scorpioides TaxID=51811 RepID=A0ABY6KQ11_9ARAC|nr:hypothetical protein LAZ67_8001114 [Cordylochernes scorpioides]